MDYKLWHGGECKVGWGRRTGGKWYRECVSGWLNLIKSYEGESEKEQNTKGGALLEMIVRTCLQHSASCQHMPTWSNMQRRQRWQLARGWMDSRTRSLLGCTNKKWIALNSQLPKMRIVQLQIAHMEPYCKHLQTTATIYRIHNKYLQQLSKSKKCPRPLLQTGQLTLPFREDCNGSSIHIAFTALICCVFCVCPVCSKSQSILHSQRHRGTSCHKCSRSSRSNPPSERTCAPNMSEVTWDSSWVDWCICCYLYAQRCTKGAWRKATRGLQHFAEENGSLSDSCPWWLVRCLGRNKRLCESGFISSFCSWSHSASSSSGSRPTPYCSRKEYCFCQNFQETCSSLPSACNFSHFLKANKMKICQASGFEGLWLVKIVKDEVLGVLLGYVICNFPNSMRRSNHVQYCYVLLEFKTSQHTKYRTMKEAVLQTLSTAWRASYPSSARYRYPHTAENRKTAITRLSIAQNFSLRSLRNGKIYKIWHRGIEFQELPGHLFAATQSKSLILNSLSKGLLNVGNTVWSPQAHDHLKPDNLLTLLVAQCCPSGLAKELIQTKRKVTPRILIREQHGTTMNNLYLRSNMDPIQVTTILVAPLSFIHLKTLQTVFCKTM